MPRSRLLRRAQALLDVFTIQQEIGRLDNLRIGLVGDLANGRTARSLAFLMSLYSNIKFYFVAPDVVKMKDDIKQFLDYKKVGTASRLSCRGLLAYLGPEGAQSLGNEERWATIALGHHGAEGPDCLQVQYEDVDDLAAVAADVDILYQTRIQKERFQVLSLISSSSACWRQMLAVSVQQPRGAWHDTPMARSLNLVLKALFQLNPGHRRLILPQANVLVQLQLALWTHMLSPPSLWHTWLSHLYPNTYAGPSRRL